MALITSNCGLLDWVVVHWTVVQYDGPNHRVVVNVHCPPTEWPLITSNCGLLDWVVVHWTVVQQNGP